MRFNKTTEYALRVLSYMAADHKRQYNTNDIYEVLKIPYRYLRRLMTDLSKLGFINSIQGKNGGYVFSKEIESITLFEIVKVTDNNYLTSECFFGFKNCSLEISCTMHEKWNSLRSEIIKILKETSLNDIKDTDPQINSSFEFTKINKTE